MTIATLLADTPAADHTHLPADVPVPNPLPKLLAGEDLSQEDSAHLFERLVLGRLEPAEIAGMRRDAERAGARLVTTAKDWIRLPPASRTGIDRFEIMLRWHDPEALEALLVPILRRAADGPVARRKGLASGAAR